jgi:hypothetical protein
MGHTGKGPRGSSDDAWSGEGLGPVAPDWVDALWRDEDRVANTWNTAYPDRRPWSEIGDEAQEEWRRVFAIYDSLKP